MTDQGLVKYQPIATTDSGSAFFKEAYAAVCQADPGRVNRDRERLQGSLLAIAEEYGQDLMLTKGQTASMSLMGAFLSLGLAEASEERLLDAIRYLAQQQIDIFIELGMSMHDDLRKRAKSAHGRSVLNGESGLYGLLDPGHERELERISRHETVFAERKDYKKALECIEDANRMITLSAHLPIASLLEHGSLAEFQANAYKRKDANTPNPLGSVFYFLIRSYLLKAMTLRPDESHPYLDYTRDSRELLLYNFIADSNAVRTLISNTFFDPKSVSELIPTAAWTVQVLFKSRVYILDTGFPSFESTAVKMPHLDEAVASLVKRVLKGFADAVKAYFLHAENVTITQHDLDNFWHPHILMMPRGASETEDGERLLNPSAERSAQAVTDLNTLLKVPPDRIVEYTSSAATWPEELRRAMLEQYPWDKLFERYEHVVIPELAILVERFGPTLLRRFSSSKKMLNTLTLKFWFQAWREEPALRNAILAYFEEDRYARRITLGGIVNTVCEMYGVGNDGRLFARLLAKAMGKIPGEYIKGVALEQLGSALYALVDHPPSVKLLYGRIHPSVREECQKKMGSNERQRILAALANPRS